jgi:hypothetical protein
VVAAQQQEHRLVAGGFVAIDDDGLDGGRQLEEGGELVDGLDAGVCTLVSAADAAGRGAAGARASASSTLAA